MGTLLELRTAVASDIRDPNFSTFTTDQVDDFINGGQADINRSYPLQVFEDIPYVSGQARYPTTLSTIFRVEVFRDDVFYALLAESSGIEAQDGWDVHAGILVLRGDLLRSLDEDTDVFNLWGYRDRARLVADNQVTELDMDGEYAVRTFSRWAAFQFMLGDRSVYKQWQGASQNSDISVNQLEQLVTIYSREWEQTRNRLRTLRRR
jgi:hypothetical protein